MNEVQQSIESFANCIRKELQKSSYQIPWPPKSDDLDVQTFPEFPLLQKFLVRLINNEPSPKSDRVKRLSLSFAQDLFFAVYTDNNTELITAVCRLGHGISYAKLSETTTEIAYSIINLCQEN